MLLWRWLHRGVDLHGGEAARVWDLEAGWLSELMARVGIGERFQSLYFWRFYLMRKKENCNADSVF
jgi:hypothetical protein